jgi:quercetin dioxygenase-like cupin family protein
MKMRGYRAITPTMFDNETMKGVAARVVIGSGDGAKNFFMRIFEIAPGGYTPRHTHDWEHEVFIHSGNGECYHGGQWHPLKPGDAVFIPALEEHQMRNTGNEVFVFVCLVPSKAPEL